MLEIPPTKEKMINMLGSKLQTLWEEQCAAIEAKYEMERIWSEKKNYSFLSGSVSCYIVL